MPLTNENRMRHSAKNVRAVEASTRHKRQENVTRSMNGEKEREKKRQETEDKLLWSLSH